MGYRDYLNRIYYDPQHPASFTGLDKLYRVVRKEGKYVLGRAKIKKWLESQETFTLHRQVNRSFRRRRVVVPYIDYQWDADTAVMKTYSKDNDDYAYFVVMVDVFSRFARTFPLKTTKGTEMSERLRKLFQGRNKPTKLRTDKGVEFRNRTVQTLLRSKNVDYFYTQNEQKSSYAERCIKTLKAKIFRYFSKHQTHRWIDILDDITQSYNATYHRSIKMPPKAVTKKDEARLWKQQYNIHSYKVPKRRAYSFRKGDTVRISHLKQPFDKEFDERWTIEFFVIDDRQTRDGVAHYTLKDTMGDDVQGSFYDSELIKVQVNDDSEYRIEKVVSRQGQNALVKWMGWPKKFNTWIPLSSLKDYKR